MRTQFSTELWRPPEAVTLAQERAEAGECRSLREPDQERTARQKQRIASARSVFTVIAVVTAIQAQMADYGLTLEDLDATDCFAPPPHHRRSVTAMRKG